MAEEIDYSKPFNVRILEDCRDPADYGISCKLDGEFGVCLGLYEFPHTWKTSSGAQGNPLTLTESGGYIWGLECWWDAYPDEHKDVPLDLQQRVLQLHKQGLAKQLETNPDPSLN